MGLSQCRDVDKLERVLWRATKETGRAGTQDMQRRPEELDSFSLEKGKLGEEGKSDHSLPQHKGGLQRRQSQTLCGCPQLKGRRCQSQSEKYVGR